MSARPETLTKAPRRAAAAPAGGARDGGGPPDEVTLMVGMGGSGGLGIPDMDSCLTIGGWSAAEPAGGVQDVSCEKRPRAGGQLSGHATAPREAARWGTEAGPKERRDRSWAMTLVTAL